MAFSARQAIALHFDIAQVLRPNEKLSVSIPCRTRTDGLSFEKAEAGIVYNGSINGNEAAVIVIAPSTSTQDVRITHLIPITSTFRYSLDQTPPSPSTSFFHQSSRPHITLNVSNGEDKVELRISSTLTARVQSVIKELKRLKESARSDEQRWSWLDFYPVQKPTLRASTWDDDDDDEEPTTPHPGSSTATLSTASSSTSVHTLQSPMTTLGISPVTKREDEYPNPFAPSFSRTAFLRKRLFARQDQWSNKKDVKIRLATYNVNDKLPPPGTTELTPMVGDGEEDILVFGFQEVGNQALLVSQGNARAEEWEAAILRALKEKAAEYEKIALVQYVGVVTIVFVKRAIRDHISQIETSERGIGLLGFGGNKAGVCVRLKIYDSTISFVNSHLAAFATALDRRRADYQTLLRGLTFPRPTEEVNPAFEEFLPEIRDKLLGVEDSHVLFWLGDLNYRVDAEDDILRAWVAEGKWKLIQEKDQLLADIKSGQSFAGFSEPPIDFPPSFKYVHGSSTLDTKRSPAYTDRIVYSIPASARVYSTPADLSCTGYTSHEIFWSDHRPVSASYNIAVRAVDEDKRREAYVAAERELEKLEEMYRPSLEILETNIDFGDVKINSSHMREIRLKNNGLVPASFNFKPPSQDKPICKPYYWPFPPSAKVEPESEITLKLSLVIDGSSAARLSMGEDDLNDVLVLRIAEGKDTFLTLQATFLPTILTLPLSYISKCAEPIRSMPLSSRKELVKTEPKGQKPVKEVWRLLEYLMAAQPSDDFWTSDIAHEHVTEIIEALDTGSELPADNARQVAKALIYLLSNLPGSLVGPRIGECEKVQSRDEAFAAIEGLEQVNTNVLIGLMSVVRLCAGIEPKSEPVEANGSAPTAVSAANENEATATSLKSEDEDDLVVYAAGEGEEDTAKAEEGIVEESKHEIATPPPEAATVDDATVEALVPAVFGSASGDLAGRKRFIRCMLDG